MVSKNLLISELPPFKNEVIILNKRQGTSDIVASILDKHAEYESEYDAIYAYFDTGNIDDTANLLFNFCKRNLKYDAECDSYQSVKSPAAILRDGQQVDCKHYSLFIGGVLDAIKRNTGDKWNWCYRFAAYNSSQAIEHVFVVVKDNGELWVDPVLDYLDQRKKTTYYKDRTPMLVSISGIGKNNSKPVEVSHDAAQSNFLIFVQQDLFSFKTLLKNNPDITYGVMKDWYVKNGFDFNQLLLVLNA